MKKIELLIIMIVCVIFVCCNNRHKQNGLGYNKYTYYDSLILSIEANKKQYSLHKVNDINACSYIYCRRNIVKAIVTCDSNFMYFKDDGQLFAYKYTLDDGSYTFVFDKDNLSYVHQGDSTRDMIHDIEYTRFEVSKKLCDIMQFNKGIKFRNIETPVPDYPNLITFRKSDLKKAPDKNSETLDLLNEHVQLFYLGVSNNQDSVYGKRWIWYKVKTETSKEGWIFGHPDFVDILNDENGQ